MNTGQTARAGALRRAPRSAALAAYLGASRLAAPLFRRVQTRRLARGKEDASRAGERWGRSALLRPDGPLVWFHAASVGESLSLLGLIGALHRARPDANVLVTTGTVTSAALLADRLPPCARHQFLPYDTPRAIAAFLDHWRPTVAVWAESELWPRLIHDTAARAVPMLLVNARLSAASARSWARARGLARALLGRFDAVLAQDDTTAGRLAALGLPADRLTVTGTLKEDAEPLACDGAELDRLRAILGPRPLWLAASTHPGEEAIVAAAHRAAFGPETLLILVPRHPGRGPALAEALSAQGWQVALRSRAEAPAPETRIYIADTLGEMGLWYRLAPVAFVGGSLVAVGGHNPYEPAALGAAILHGPHVANFAGIHARLDRAGGALEVTDAPSLAAALRRLSAPGAPAAQAARAAAAANSATNPADTNTLRRRRNRCHRNRRRGDRSGAGGDPRPPARGRPQAVTDKPEVLVTNLHRRFTGVSATAAAVLRRHLDDGVKAALVGTALPGCPAPLTRRAALHLSRTPPPHRPFTLWHVRRNPEMALALFARDILRLPIRIVFTSAAIRRHSAFPRWLIGRMDAVIATTETAAALVPHVRAVVPHGVDIETFRPAEDRAAAWAALGHGGGYGIATIGRIRPEKGTDTFVEAMIRALPGLPGATALVIGTATARHRGFLDGLKARIARAGLADRIVFVGEIPADRMAQVMRALSLLVAVPRYEGYGMTPIEAMASGVPVVLTDTGNFRAFAGDGAAGRIVPFGDAAATAEAVAQVLAEGARRTRPARARAETHFSLRGEAAGIRAVYEQIWADLALR